jgi:hypothetical protein
MMAGMVPMALGLGEGGEQTAPLGRAVIGGLAAATLATLVVLPSVFAVVQGRSGTRSVSLDPDDAESRFFDRGPGHANGEVVGAGFQPARAEGQVENLPPRPDTPAARNY